MTSAVLLLRSAGLRRIHVPRVGWIGGSPTSTVTVTLTRTCSTRGSAKDSTHHVATSCDHCVDTMTPSTLPETPTEHAPGGAVLLEPYPIFGWNPDPTLSEDDNFMTLTLLVTRASQLKHGSMACLLVQPKLKSNERNAGEPTHNPHATIDDLASGMCDRLIAVATNHPLYSKTSSDVHAEVAAVGQAATGGRSTRGATAYITMPPCKNCAGVLWMAGVGRVVSRYTGADHVVTALEQKGIDMVAVEDRAVLAERVQAIVQRHREAEVEQELDVEKEKG